MVIKDDSVITYVDAEQYCLFKYLEFTRLGQIIITLILRHLYDTGNFDFMIIIIMLYPTLDLAMIINTVFKLWTGFPFSSSPETVLMVMTGFSYNNSRVTDAVTLLALIYWQSLRCAGSQLF